MHMHIYTNTHKHTHTHTHTHTYIYIYIHDRLCGLVVTVQIQRSRVRSPALPDFLSSSGSGTGSTQPREVN